MVSDRLAGLGVLTKPESMGVCFVGKRPLQQFLSSYIDCTPGRYGMAALVIFDDTSITSLNNA